MSHIWWGLPAHLFQPTAGRIPTRCGVIATGLRTHLPTGCGLRSIEVRVIFHSPAGIPSSQLRKKAFESRISPSNASTRSRLLTRIGLLSLVWCTSVSGAGRWELGCIPSGTGGNADPRSSAAGWKLAGIGLTAHMLQGAYFE